MSKRAAIVAAGVVTISLALGGCGVSVDAGGENAATHPASGIFVSNTVGGASISVKTNPTVVYQPPSSTPPASVPSGLTSAVASIESLVTGGCWQDAHYGNVYGAYDQLFWWQGDCGDTIGQVTVELYPTAADCQRRGCIILARRHCSTVTRTERAGRRVLQRPPRSCSPSWPREGPGPGAGYGGVATRYRGVRRVC